MKNIKKKLKMLLALTIANIKMFFRDKGALFWSLFFPFLIIGIFGVLDFGGGAQGTIGLVYDEETEIYTEQLKKAFEEKDSYKISTGELDQELEELENDSRIAIFKFETGKDKKVNITTYIGKENEDTGSIIALIAEKILSDVSMQMQHIELPFTMEQEIINTNNLRNIDFIVPGVIAMSIMQGSLFGVIGAIVESREKGILKRLFATPLPKDVFLISNIITRTIISLMQIAILLGFSYLVFQVKIVGSLYLVFFTALLGSLVFLALGILISGLAKTTETARAMITPVQMIFMFTGGVYFPREILPKWLFDITQPLPFTHLADVLRNVMAKGYGLGTQSIQNSALILLGWLVGLVVLAINTFKWNGE